MYPAYVLNRLCESMSSILYSGLPLNTGCHEVIRPLMCEDIHKKPQTSLYLSINTLESSWRKVPAGKSRLPLSPWPCNHQRARPLKKCPKGNVDQQGVQQMQSWTADLFQTDQEEICWKQEVLINLLHSCIWRQNLPMVVGRGFITRGLILNSRH